MGFYKQNLSEFVKKLPILFPNWELICTFGVMRIISRKTLRQFWDKHKDSEQSLKSWYHENVNASWKSPNEIKKKYPSASIIADNRIVFNIKGNKYRLIVKVNYDYGMMWIRFAGTHAEYDKIDATKI
jgi:mRNA interferase HigB